MIWKFLFLILLKTGMKRTYLLKYRILYSSKVTSIANLFVARLCDCSTTQFFPL